MITAKELGERIKAEAGRYDCNYEALHSDIDALVSLAPAETAAGAREIIEQLIACHDEPTCPAIAVAEEWLAASPQPPATHKGAWMPIETAPRGSGENGPSDVRDPAYVEPPHLLLNTAEGVIVGYYDWYYHPGYGRGARFGESAWRDCNGGQAYEPTHWMPLPEPPAAAALEEPHHAG